MRWWMVRLGMTAAGCTAAACTAIPAPWVRGARPVPPMAPATTWSRPPAALLPDTADPGPVTSDSAAASRLLTFIRAWHLLSLHHPAIRERQALLDATFSTLAPVVHRHGDPATLRAVYARLADVFDDPTTRVEPTTSAPDPTLPATVAVERTLDSILVVRLTSGSRYTDAHAVLLRDALAQAPARVILDLRTSAPDADPDSVAAFMTRTALAQQLADQPVAVGSWRTRRPGGAIWRNGQWMADDGWLVREPATLTPSRGTGVRPPVRRVVLLANANSVLPPELLALRVAGSTSRTTLMTEQTTSLPVLHDIHAAPSVRVPVGDDLVLRIRTGELVQADGQSARYPDLLVNGTGAAPDGTPALQAALDLLRGTSPLPPVIPPGVPQPLRDTSAYPTYGDRILAAATLWSHAQARHAHRDLYDDEVDTEFLRLLPRIESARSAEEYAAALLELTSVFADAQVTLTGDAVDRAVGIASLPFRVQWIDGRALITDVLPDSVTRALGITSGLEVIAAEGYPIGAWLQVNRRAVSAPNDWSRANQLMARLVRGGLGRVLLRVRDPAAREGTREGARELQVDVPRREAFRALLPIAERTGPVVRRLADGIRYLDAQRLAGPWVRDTLAAQRDARAWIIDLRGRLLDSGMVADALLEAVRRNPRVTVALEVHRYRTTPCLAPTPRDATSACDDERATRRRLAVGDTTGQYRGRVVVLVDERTVGAAERLAASLEAVADAMLIGTPTAGSPAETVAIPLPGALTLHLPMHELRRADGGQWQRVGLTPLVEARRAMRSVRTGGDEVIDRATTWLQQQLDGSPRRRR